MTRQIAGVGAAHWRLGVSARRRADGPRAGLTESKRRPGRCRGLLHRDEPRAPRRSRRSALHCCRPRWSADSATTSAVPTCCDDREARLGALAAQCPGSLAPRQLGLYECGSYAYPLRVQMIDRIPRSAPARYAPIDVAILRPARIKKPSKFAFAWGSRCHVILLRSRLSAIRR